jgi:FlaA1/EpsC-like NDP-sugar epimerase
MVYIKNLLFHDKIHSKWLVLLIDLLTIFLSLCLSFSLKGPIDFRLSNIYYIAFYSSTAILVFLLMGIHTRIVRYSNTKDMLRVFFAVLISNLTFLFVYHVLFAAVLNVTFKIIWEILLINFFISSTALMSMRIIIKDLFTYLKESGWTNKKENVLIYGSGKTSMLIKNAVEAQKGFMVNVCGFIDTGADKIHKCLEQTHVYPVKAIGRLKHKFAIETMLITSEDLMIDGRREAIEKCIELSIKVITVPPSDQWLNGKPNVNQFKDLKIEDLLEREPIELCKEHIFNDIKGKRVLVTGAAGSIGSEIVRQVLTYSPEYVILCDQAETPLHDMQLEVEDGVHGHKTKIFIADIQNANRIKTLFNLYQPQIVFHAAAYKHVPMMENNPTEAVLTNVGGTKILADISMAFGVEKMIMISTDKAVRPTNVMGATKRIAEMYIQSLNDVYPVDVVVPVKGKKMPPNKTKFITTRFGNVLGSNGSVIPRFKAQIEKGGPVTVTHPDITRYFMTIPEATQLVLEAATMGKGGEIFLFDMGKPVRIADLAANMIKLAGYTLNEDIKIVYTGLRPGEKLYEELLNEGELVMPTYNKDIKISKNIPCCHAEIDRVVKELLELSMLNDADLMISKMKHILPDFISNNSQYERLDLKMVVQ